MNSKLKIPLVIGMLVTGLLCSKAQTWEWSESVLSYPRSGLSAAVANDTIFYSGGRIDDNLNFSITVDVFDLGNGSWEIENPYGSARWQSSSVSANGFIFIAGGNNFPGNESYDDVDIYNIETGEWTLENLSEARVHLGVTAHANKVFFAGGFGYDATSSFFYDVVDIYNTETGTWSTANLSSPRTLVAAAAAGNKVFFAGGADESWQVTDVVDIYDIETGEWTEETLSAPRAGIGAVAYENKVYFAGGTFSDNTSSAAIDVYDVENSAWDEPLSLSGPRIVTALKVYDALVFTGVCDFIDFSLGFWAGENGRIDVYYPENGEMDTVQALNPARVFYAYGAYDKKVYFAGGLANEEVFDIINILEYTPAVPSGILEDSKYEMEFQIHPNPIQSKAQVAYHLQNSRHINITVYTNTGQAIKVLSNGFSPQGDNRLLFNAASLNPGVYYIVLKTNQSAYTKKIIKLN